MLVKDHIISATKKTAEAVAKLIKEQGFSKNDVLTEEESLRREKMIDQAGVDAMSASLKDIPFTLEIIGSEGRKHIHQYGEALPFLMGTFGSGDTTLDCVNDVVEGSKAAKLNSPGAISVIAVSSHQGLMGTPDDIDYMDKLFGPPQLKGKISLKNSVEENLTKAVETFEVKPSEINVVIMDRDRNKEYIEACQKFGVNLILIKAGDFLPSILACTKQKGIYLVMGSGGFEEGILAAVAAKALGAVCEGRGWPGYEAIWTVDDLVPGKKEDCLVAFTTITEENKWFNLAPSQTLTIDSSGINY